MREFPTAQEKRLFKINERHANTMCTLQTGYQCKNYSLQSRKRKQYAANNRNTKKKQVLSFLQ